jgi:phosphopentomutase
VIPVEKLYEYCQIARKILTGEHAVGRVIARPFTGRFPDFKRTSNRHDFSFEPPSDTFLDEIKAAGLQTIAVGKINDIFAGCGITEFIRTIDNSDGMAKTFDYIKKDWQGLLFVNLVDFDMKYGHRNDPIGYAQALNIFDCELKILLELMKKNDVLMITADHGCDPGTESTDHSREYVPLLIFGDKIMMGADIKTRKSFADAGKTVCDMLDVSSKISGSSFKNLIVRK